MAAAAGTLPNPARGRRWAPATQRRSQPSQVWEELQPSKLLPLETWRRCRVRGAEGVAPCAGGKRKIHLPRSGAVAIRCESRAVGQHPQWTDVSSVVAGWRAEVTLARARRRSLWRRLPLEQSTVRGLRTDPPPHIHSRPVSTPPVPTPRRHRRRGRPPDDRRPDLVASRSPTSEVDNQRMRRRSQELRERRCPGAT